MNWRKEAKMMPNKIHLYSFFLCLFYLGSSSGFSQSKWEDDGKIDDKQIIIEKNRKIELPEASRNFKKIEFSIPKPEPTIQKYDFKTFPNDLPQVDTKIRVLSVKDDQLKKLYGNYIKLGGGNYSTFFGEGYFNSKRDDKLAYGAFIKYYNSLQGPVQNSGNNDFNLGGYTRFIHPRATATASLEYQRFRYNFYGYDQQKVAKTNDEVRLVYNNFSAGVNIKNGSDSVVRPEFYTVGLKYNYINNFKGSEGELHALIKGGYKLDSIKGILLQSELSFIGRTDSVNWSRNLVSIQPGFYYTLAGIRLKGSLNFTFLNDTIGGQKNFQLYPVLDAEYDLFNKKFTAFAGIDGRMVRNTWRTFSVEMPFLVDRVPVFHSNKTFEGYAGLRGSLLPSTYLKTSISYANYKNYAFFVNDITDSSKFTALYETGNTGIFNFNAQIQYAFKKKFKFDIGADVFSYSTSTLAKAWHRPSFVLNAGLNYNLNDKILVRLNVYYLGGIVAQSPTIKNKEKTLNDIVDLSLKLEYRFSELFSAYTEINNILGTKYERYLFYQKKGINFLIGLTYTF